MNVTLSHKLLLASCYFGRVEDATHACRGATGVKIATRAVNVIPSEDVTTLKYVEGHDELKNTLK